ncbi:MAG: hypothetical protein ACK5XN_38230, partial [Bacteroidota bacterium]
MLSLLFSERRYAVTATDAAIEKPIRTFEINETPPVAAAVEAPICAETPAQSSGRTGASSCPSFSLKRSFIGSLSSIH